MILKNCLALINTKTDDNLTKDFSKNTGNLAHGYLFGDVCDSK